MTEITLDLLRKLNAPKEITDCIYEHRNSWHTLMDVYSDSNAPGEVQHWLNSWVSATAEERARYIQNCKIENSQNVISSSSITNSKNVGNSSFVVDSENIFSSSAVNNSRDISSSYRITDGEMILGSNQVTKSHHIIESNFITNSSNLSQCSILTDSSNCLRCDSCSELNSSIFCHALDNSYYCAHCGTLSNSLFCYNANDGENLVFNKPVNKSILVSLFEVVKTLTPATPVASWPTSIVGSGLNPTKIEFNKFYQFTKEDLALIKTFPNYDPSIMYGITLNPIFLK